MANELHQTRYSSLTLDVWRSCGRSVDEAAAAWRSMRHRDALRCRPVKLVFLVFSLIRHPLITIYQLSESVLGVALPWQVENGVLSCAPCHPVLLGSEQVSCDGCSSGYPSTHPLVHSTHGFREVQSVHDPSLTDLCGSHVRCVLTVCEAAPPYVVT